MNQNFHKNLNFPNSPIRTENLRQLLINKKNKRGKRSYIYVDQNFKDYLTTDITNIFQSLNIFPNTLVIFGHVNDANYKQKSLVHSDIIYQNEKWYDIPCAINWEITNTMANFYWWDVKDSKKCYPPPWSEEEYLPPMGSDYYLERVLGSGIHYKKWLNNETDDYSVLENSILNKNNPMLIRTDVPHSVEYANYVDRISISLRFSLTQIPDWKSALEIFKNFY